MWFADNHSIGRLNPGAAPGSAATVFTLPPPQGSADFVASGGDGAIWFSDFFNNAIGRITTAGVVTEFPIPTANAGPQGIALGPADEKLR